MLGSLNIRIISIIIIGLEVRRFKKSRLLIGFLLVLLFVGLILWQELGLEQSVLAKDGHYTTPEDVALYIHTYGELPLNFITKVEARALGWDSDKGNLWDVSNHLSIGGDVFRNLEGLLPNTPGRQWYECDVNYQGGFRGPERIVYSNDGLIYYTADHYASFKKLY